MRNLTIENKIIGLLGQSKRLPLRSYSVTRLVCCPRKTYCGFLGIPELKSEGIELIFARGRAHHGVLEVFRPNEVSCTKDGIRGDIDMMGERATEIFTTTVSSKNVEKDENVPEVFNMKVKQLKSYLHMINEFEGDLLVFFLFGDYTRLKVLPNGKTRYIGIIPELRDWTLVFEDNDLKRNWEEILAKREVIEECRKYNVSKATLSFIPKIREMWVKWRDGLLSKEELYDLIATRQVVISELKLPDWTGEEWECKNCGYAYLCPNWNKEVASV